MKTTEIKKRLKQAGIDIKLISVKQSRSWISVKIKDYSISKPMVEELLKDLDTCKNVSHDWDSIYVGTTVSVGYQVDKVPEEIQNYLKSEVSKHPDFTLNDFGKVENLAKFLQKTGKLSQLSSYEISDLIHRVF